MKCLQMYIPILRLLRMIKLNATDDEQLSVVLASGNNPQQINACLCSPKNPEFFLASEIYFLETANLKIPL